MQFVSGNSLHELPTVFNPVSREDNEKKNIKMQAAENFYPAC